VAERLSPMAAGDFYGTEGGDGSGSGLLESVLERQEAVFPVSAVDARDEGVR
jgi:hypothetical protein